MFCRVHFRTSTAGEKPVDLGPLKAEVNKGDKTTPHKFIYRFQYWARYVAIFFSVRARLIGVKVTSPLDGFIENPIFVHVEQR